MKGRRLKVKCGQLMGWGNIFLSWKQKTAHTHARCCTTTHKAWGWHKHNTVRGLLSHTYACTHTDTHSKHCMGPALKHTTLYGHHSFTNTHTPNTIHLQDTIQFSPGTCPAPQGHSHWLCSTGACMALLLNGTSSPQVITHLLLHVPKHFHAPADAWILHMVFIFALQNDSSH